MAANDRMLLPPPPPQWVLDLNSGPVSKPKSSGVPDPPGFVISQPVPGKRSNASKQAATRKGPTPQEMDTLKLKKAWEMAIAPAKQLPMNAIGMYMTGNSLQIFSIYMVFTLFKNPLVALASINSAFTRFESEGTRSQMLLVKLAYVAANLLALGLGIYKVNAMGLLPTTRSDWLAWETPRIPLERAYPEWSLHS